MDLKNKKILVTGADGFIGSALVEELASRHVNVRAFVMYNAFNRWGWLDNTERTLLNSIEVVAGDIRDGHFVEMAMEGIDLVFHLAALITIPFSYHAPESYVDTNVKGTLNVLNAARKLGVEKVLTTSTSEVYGTAQYTPIDESHPLNAQSPYSASKIGADMMADAFHRSFELPVTLVRPFNTYGPRQSARAIIPTVITQLLCGRAEIQLGDLTPTRDLVFVRDTVEAFIRIAESPTAIGETVNIATGTDISIGTLAQKIIDKINPDARIVADQQRLRPEASEVRRLLGDNRKLKNLTNWVPDTPLDDGLEMTIDWFRRPENLRRFKSDEYNI